MAEKRPQNPELGRQASAKNDDLLDGLETLLEEEGIDLEEEGEEGEDEMAALFEDEEDEEKSAAVETSSAPRGRRVTRDVREDRRNRDMQAYKSLDAQMQMGPMGIQIAEDRLTAWISRITGDNSLEEILHFLHQQEINFGIDQETIRASIIKAKRGQPVFGVVVAKGRQPKVSRESQIVYHLPKEVMYSQSTSSKLSDFERLKQTLEGPHLEGVKSWKGTVKMVRKGEILAELQPAHIELGQDVFGHPIELKDREEVGLEVGENTELSEDGRQCLAAIYGYAGLVDGVPTVQPPIWVSENHMEARFVYIPQEKAPPPPSSEEIRELLEIMWIEQGIMEKQIDLIHKRLARGLPLPVTLPIAQGTTEVAGEDAQINYAFDAFSVLGWNHIETLLKMDSAKHMAEALEALYAEEGTPRFTAFYPGEIVAEKTPATEGVPGHDIQGEEVVPQEGKDESMEVGENLSISEDQLQATADIFGFTCLRWDIQVTLLSPLWISPDKLRVYFINLPQAGATKFPTVEQMQALLAREKIKFGFHAERWSEILEELQAGQRQDYMILVAEGIPPQQGRDAEFDWAIDIGERQPGKILEDGSIDFRERNLTTVVKEADLLGRLVPPQPGVPGKDIYGTEMRPPAPLNIEVVTDTRIYAEPGEEGIISFYAEIGGGISTTTKVKEVNNRTQKRITINVCPITNIEGDVDYTTGNIDFNGDVVIGGSVHPQFSVRATGSVVIEGYVEAGAYITAGKDILIKRGVVGANTELVAGGDVMSKYIQEATVRASGDVKAGSYIFNASVRASGQVVVTGKGEGKSRALVGGLIWGGQGITARSIGSPYNTNTKLVAGIDPDFVNRAEQIRANMQACEDKQHKLLEKIGLETMDVERIKQKLAICRNPKEKQAILLCVKRIAKVAELEQNLQKELEEIAESQRQLALKTSINIQSELFAGVELRIGEQTMVAQDDAEKVSFRLVQDDEELSIQMGAYKGPTRQ